MRTTDRRGRGYRSRNSSDPERRRIREGELDMDYDLEDYVSYGGDEYDEEGRFRGEYEGESDEMPDEGYDEAVDDYSIVTQTRSRRGSVPDKSVKQSARPSRRSERKGSTQQRRSRRGQEENRGLRETARSNGQETRGTGKKKSSSESGSTKDVSRRKRSSSVRKFGSARREREREIATQGRRVSRGGRSNHHGGW